MHYQDLLREVYKLIEPDFISDRELERAKLVKDYQNTDNYYMIGEGDIRDLDLALPSATVGKSLTLIE